MPPKRKTNSEEASSEGLRYVHVLSVAEADHANNHIVETEIVGVYESKEAAAAAASGAKSLGYGTIEGAMRTYDDDVEDYRNGPPDDGVLIQCGGEDCGEGDWVRVLINKFPVLGMPPASSEPTKKKGKMMLATKAARMGYSRKETDEDDGSSDYGDY